MAELFEQYTKSFKDRHTTDAHEKKNDPKEKQGQWN